MRLSMLDLRRFSMVAAALAVLAWSMPAAATTYPLVPGQAAVGNLQTYITKPHDTLLDIAMDYDLGYTELISANPGIDPWLPPAGTSILIPSFFLLPDAPRTGIVINIARQRLYYYPPDGASVETLPIGVGVEGTSTPLGDTRIVRKKAGPTWYPPADILASEPGLPKVVPPGPDNPMGAYALYLGWPTFAIHGTNKPYGVGRNVSHGCIRLYPDDVEKLFGEVKVGTSVRVIEDDAQLAWIGDDLYLAVYPNKQQTDEIDIGHPLPSVPPDHVLEEVMTAADQHMGRVDWKLVRKLAAERTGIPTRITKRGFFERLGLH